MMRIIRGILVICLGLAAGLVGSAEAHAEMTPPLCEVEPMSDGCAGPPTSGGPVGRTFLTADDVMIIGPTAMTLRYTPSEWDSILDFYFAAETYWDLYAPTDRVCTFGGSGGCTSATMSDTSSGATVSFTPEP